MADDDLIGAFPGRSERPARWAVAAFVGSCAFTSSALLLLILALR